MSSEKNERKNGKRLSHEKDARDNNVQNVSMENSNIL